MIREALADNMRLIIWWLMSLLAFGAFAFAISVVPSGTDAARENCRDVGGYYNSLKGTCEKP